MQLPIVFLLSSPFPTQCKAAVTTVGSEKPSTFFTVRSTHGLNSSTSRFGRDIPPILQNNIKCTSGVIIHLHWWNCWSSCFKTLCTCVGLYHTDVTHMIQPPSLAHAHSRIGAKTQTSYHLHKETNAHSPLKSFRCFVFNDKVRMADNYANQEQHTS